MNAETRDQLALYLLALERDFYHPLGSVELSGFTADRDYTLEQAAAHPRSPMPEGTVWGGAWQYAWLFAEFALPQEAEGERIVLSLEPGGESTLFLNGRPFGTRRAEWVEKRHHYLVDQTVSLCAKEGERFALAMEAYGGTPLPCAPRGRCATGPVFPEEGVRMEPLPRARIGRNTFGVWNEDAYQLWLDASMLRDIHETQPEDAYLREAIGYALERLLDSLDLEQPFAARRQAYRAAREQLAPFMAAKNGTFAPSMAAIANSHLDVAWLWPTAETRRKTARTFAQQLRLLKEYPEALFLQSQCVLYEMCRENYPELFEEIRAAVRRGQWIAEGGMWVEPDTNLAGGEAIVRQLLYGLNYFQKELGVESKIVWLPDSFGYSAALPQIIVGFGMRGLTTQKIFWTYNDAEKFPHHAFRWRGMDGTEIPCYLHMFYESFVDAKTLAKRWHDRVDRDGTGEFLLPFGYGDGGGGPTRDDYEQIRREKDLQGVPKMSYETPADFLEKRKKAGFPVYCGELYFQCHRGTYTTQAKIKRLNRQSENELRALEMWAAFAAWRGKATYPATELEALWKKVLLNHFHDILPGSAIGQVYDEARLRYEEVLAGVKVLGEKTLTALGTGGEGVTLYHTLSHEAERVVELDERFAAGAVTAEGELVPCTPCSTGAFALVKLPAVGRVTLLPAGSGAKAPPATAERTENGYRLRNACMEAELNLHGEITSLRATATGARCVAGASNRLHFYRDVPRAYDAWDIDSQTGAREIFPEIAAESEITETCGLRAAVRFTLRVLNSTIVQTVSLDANAMRLDFFVQADWHERHKLMKVSFDTGVQTDEAANQIQFGHVMRPTHRSRAFDADRFEVCNHGFTALYDATHGAAVLNNGKYGVSMEGSVISLSLLRGATHPDPAADQGAHEYRYAYFVWRGAFETSGVVYEAAALNAPVWKAEGAVGREAMLEISDPACVLETVKLAEDGGGDMILRLYESMNGARCVSVRVPENTAAAWRCGLDETKNEMLKIERGSVQIAMHPFEIVTLRVEKSMREERI